VGRDDFIWLHRFGESCRHRSHFRGGAEDAARSVHGYRTAGAGHVQLHLGL